MTKEKGTFRNGFFFLLGVCVYSLLFWLSGKNYAHVFGAILVGLVCYIVYMTNMHPRQESKLVKPRDVMYLCIGVVFDSFSGGFPFNILPPF